MLRLDFKLPTLRCKRCKHQWKPTKPVIRICPKCKSKHWQTKKTDGNKGRWPGHATLAMEGRTR